MDREGRTDEDLLAATLKERGAFATFFGRHETTVLRYFGRRVRDPEMTADLTAETFAAALEGVERFDPARGSAVAWLLGIARHVLASSWRAGQVQSKAREALRIQPLQLDAAHKQAIARLIAEDHLQALDPLERDAVQGRVLDDESYTSLAAAMNCSEQVIRQRVSRGLGRLRELAQRGEI